MNRKSSFPHQWKINLKCVYRQDRQERLEQAFALVADEPSVILKTCKMEEPSYEQNKCCPLRKGIQ